MSLPIFSAQRIFQPGRSHMNRSSLSALTIVAASLAPFGVQAANLHVPSAYSTIQLAIDAAVSGDVVRVAAGTYPENLVIDSKAISVIGADAATTIIDGGAAGSASSAILNVTSGQVVLARLTIRNGAAYDRRRCASLSSSPYLVPAGQCAHGRTGAARARRSGSSIANTAAAAKPDSLPPQALEIALPRLSRAKRSRCSSAA